MSETNKTKTPYYEAVANKFIEKLEQGTAPWQRPWKGGEEIMPHNPTTGKAYKGVNSMYLMLGGYQDPRWMTYKQAQSVGAQVRSQEQGMAVMYWQRTEDVIKNDSQGKPVIGADGKPEKIAVMLERPRAFWSTVFNAEQIDGLPAMVQKEQTAEQAWAAIEKAEEVLTRSGADINHSESSRAFYRPSNDSIHMPNKSQFPDAIGYYQTAHHELAHWTGHESRLNRDILNPFGSEKYAREELVAEIASVMIGSQTGIGFEPREENVSYVSSWVKALKEDPKEIFRAAAEAEKVKDFVLSKTLEHELQKAPIVEQEAQRAMDKPHSIEKAYINVPFAEKDQARELGAKWDKSAKSWYIPEGVESKLFEQWADQTDKATKNEINRDQDSQAKEYLAVPYGERSLARAAGALWDTGEKAWYKGPNAEHEKLERWAIKENNVYQTPALDPREEFSKVLQSAGCVIGGEHPVMDGKKHRIETEGDIGGAKSGFYVGHLDGRPAGYIKNNRTGAEAKWKHKGYTVSEEDKAKLQAIAAQKQSDRAAEQKQAQENTASRVQEQIAKLQPATVTPYLEKKGLQASPGTYMDADAKTLCVPAMDVNSKVWTMQYIQEDGTKRFAKDGKKEGCFHPVGCKSMNDLGKAKSIVIAEGYSTAKSISEAIKQPVVAVFDSGNLKIVAQDLHAKFPDKPIIIAGDDDKHLIDNPKIRKNVGKEKAEEAAKGVGGIVVLPTFAPGEQAKDLKGFTDFNDLASKSRLGKDGVQRQMKAAIDRSLLLQQKQVKKQSQQRQVEKKGQGI